MFLSQHMAVLERQLLASAEVPSSAGHPLHKGTAREAFIRAFLATHLTEQIAVGTGEVIDYRSSPGDSRPQLDVVLYDRSFPRIDFGGFASGFLIESVKCTIEVKSTLDYRGVRQATAAAARVKQLEEQWRGGFYGQAWFPPSPLGVLVAYKGPARMSTVLGWISRAHEELGIPVPDLDPTLAERQGVAASGLDLVCVLGKGFVQFDNCPLDIIRDEARAELPTGKWITVSTADQTLLWLFLVLTKTLAAVRVRTFDPTAYVAGTRFRSRFS